ncbi:uncharacterized protein METZ01_LOCUS268745 [marine metagenome]|uniref:Uncharacterized protein n=1 Tax=marine metagenome TaxID=408172 RepID=A0A382JZM1_9ZZZZ
MTWLPFSPIRAIKLLFALLLSSFYLMIDHTNYFVYLPKGAESILPIVQEEKRLETVKSVYLCGMRVLN